jgi:hypothetical protein
MTLSLLSLGEPDDPDSFIPRLEGLLETTHALWSAPDERRRMRAYGFRPAVEPGVLKREWHGLNVRISSTTFRAVDPDAGELVYRAGDRAVLLNGEPFATTEASLGLVRQLLDLVQNYERWVEVREGRQARIERLAQVQSTDTDRRQINALAETRRLQRMLQIPRSKTR